MTEEKLLSPGRIAWLRLKKNPSAVAGLFIILLSVFLSVFAYFIIPDTAPYGNTMCLPVSLQKPGFRCSFLVLPGDEMKSAGISVADLFRGSEKNYQLIPVEKWKVENDSVQYTEFGSPDLVQKIPLTAFSVLFRGMPVEEQKQLMEEVYIQNRHFLLGTDRFGRDLFSRLVIGTRVSLSVGLIAVFISLLIGITLGALAGYFRGWVDRFILWLINVIWSIPTLLLVIAITMALGKGFAQVFIAVGLTMWVEVARIVRGQFFGLREQQFVEAGNALGYSHGRLILKHILPNCIGPVIVIAASNFASAILLEAGLSFLGMGAQPPVPSWGMMIKESYSYIVVDAAYLAVWPGAAIALLVLAFTWLGNGLRDAFDTKLSD